MKVRIDAGGREVEIECSGDNVSVKDIAAEALSVWSATAGAREPSDGPAFGLTLGERSPDGRGVYPLGLGEGQPVPVQS